MWGQEHTAKEAAYRDGIIPTRVGTSYYEVESNNCPKDHPHACGDKQSLELCICALLGSSPRMWGQEAPDL